MLILLLPQLGNWLVVEDELTPVDAIIVLGGHLPFRSIEAGELYLRGIAPEVWLLRHDIHAEDRALSELGIYIPQESVYNKAVLERMGVPADAIRILPSQIHTTQDEVRFVASELHRRNFRRVVFVTSKFHTRRVQITWRASVDTGRLTALVKAAQLDPFDAAHWWRHSGDAFMAIRELFGILNVWVHYPISSYR